MRLPNPFETEVLIRMEGNDRFVSTVRFGWFYRQVKAFAVRWEAPAGTVRTRAPSRARSWPSPRNQKSA